MATMLTGQGIVDPAGDQHLTAVLVDFFEARMVGCQSQARPLPVLGRGTVTETASILTWEGFRFASVQHYSKMCNSQK